MIKSIIGGVAAAALLSGPAFAAPARPTVPPKPGGPPKAGGLPWVVIPTETGCRTDLELIGRSGGITPVSLISDGQLVSLRFFKDDLPTRAFLPVRVDRARFSNLMLRGTDGAGELVLSEETEAAMKRGSSLDVAWLAAEPLSISLGGSEQGLADLRVCGAQTASRHRERIAADQAARDRAEAEGRAKALNEAQLAAVQAQTAVADAQRRQVEETAERQRRTEAAAQERVYQEARQRAYEDERRRAYEQPRPYDDDDDEDPRWAPARPAYPQATYPPSAYPQPAYPQPLPRWGYQRY